MGRHHNTGGHHAKFFWALPRARKDPRILRGTGPSLDQKEEPMHEDWMELLHDLIIVAMLLKLGATLKYCGDSFVNFWVVFHIFIAVWRNGFLMDSLINRVVENDLMQILLFLGVCFGTFLMSLSIQDDPDAASDENYQRCYSSRDLELLGRLGFGISRFCLAVSFARVAYALKVHRTHHCVLVTVNLLIVFLAVFQGTTIYFSDQQKQYKMSHNSLLFITNTMDFFVTDILILIPWYHARMVADGILPVHIQHLTARFNIFVMITLGEGVIQMLIEPLTETNFVSDVMLSVTGFFILFALCFLYFDSQPHEIKDHVIRKSRFRAYWLKVLYPLFYFSLFSVGASFKLLVFELKDEQSTKHPEEPHAAFIRRLAGHLGPGWDVDGAIPLFVATSLTFAQVFAMILRYIHDGMENFKHPACEGEPAKWHVGEIVGFFGMLIGCLAHMAVPLLSTELLLWPHLVILLPACVLNMKSHSHDDHHTHGGHHHGEEDHAEHSRRPTSQLEDSPHEGTLGLGFGPAAGTNLEMDEEVIGTDTGPSTQRRSDVTPRTFNPHENQNSSFL